MIQYDGRESLEIKKYMSQIMSVPTEKQLYSDQTERMPYKWEEQLIDRYCKTAVG